MPTETETKPVVYQGMLHIDEPVYVWTPGGEERSPGWMALGKSPASRTLPQSIAELGAGNPKQKPLTSGEWMQARLYLQRAVHELEEDMTTGAYERTSTLVDYDHGLVIQIPEADADGNLVTDEKGIIRGRHTWEMALPKKSFYINQAPKDLAKFFNTIHGMDDAAGQLPDYAYFGIDDNPTGVRNLLRGRWRCADRGDRACPRRWRLEAFPLGRVCGFPRSLG